MRYAISHDCDGPTERLSVDGQTDWGCPSVASDMAAIVESRSETAVYVHPLYDQVNHQRNQKRLPHHLYDWENPNCDSIGVTSTNLGAGWGDGAFQVEFGTPEMPWDEVRKLRDALNYALLLHTTTETQLPLPSQTGIQ